MWILTPIGFFSAVEHRSDPDRVVVRARVRADLETLRDLHLPDAEIQTGTGSDYRHRVIVEREAWAQTVQAMAMGIDYGNFKNAVAARQGTERADAYHRVWDVLYELQRREA